MSRQEKYYAIAIGREQKITTDYYEMKRLTHGYPNAKFKSAKSYEDAQKYIDDVVAELTGRELNDFEEERKLMQAFSNNDRRIVTPKTGIFITANYYEKSNVRVFDPIMGDYVNRSVIKNNSISATIKTPAELSFSKEVSDEQSNTYNYSLIEYGMGRCEKQKLLIMSLISILEELFNSDVREFTLFTDSSYLTEIMTNNVFFNPILIGIPIAYEIELKKLYELMLNFDYIYINYYSGGLMPDLLKSNIKKALELNKATV